MMTNWFAAARLEQDARADDGRPESGGRLDFALQAPDDAVAFRPMSSFAFKRASKAKKTLSGALEVFAR
jgi:hypothetical protein